MRQLTIPERHQLKVARATLLLSDGMAVVMGGPTKHEARGIIQGLTGRRPCEECTSRDAASGLRVCNPCAASYRRAIQQAGN